MMASLATPITSAQIAAQQDAKPLRPFGSASIRKPITEARADAERTEIQLHRQRQDMRPDGARG